MPPSRLWSQVRLAIVLACSLIGAGAEGAEGDDARIHPSPAATRTVRPLFGRVAMDGRPLAPAMVKQNAFVSGVRILP